MAVFAPRERPGGRATDERLRPCAGSPLRRAGRRGARNDARDTQEELQGDGEAVLARRARETAMGRADGAERTDRLRRRDRPPGRRGGREQGRPVVAGRPRHDGEREGADDRAEYLLYPDARPTADGERGARPAGALRPRCQRLAVAEKGRAVEQHGRRLPARIPGRCLRDCIHTEGGRRLRGVGEQERQAPGARIPDGAEMGRRGAARHATGGLSGRRRYTARETDDAQGVRGGRGTRHGARLQMGLRAADTGRRGHRKEHPAEGDGR